MKTTKILLLAAILSVSICSYSTAQVVTVDLQENHSGDGGGILLNEENGTRVHTRLQPDASGGGAFFQLASAAQSLGLRYEGQPTSGTTNGILTIAGVSTSIFNTNLTGDAAVSLPAGAISSLERNNEPGVTNSLVSSTTTIGTSITVLRSRTINVPTDGYVVAYGNSQVEVNHTDGTNSYTQFGVSSTNTSFSAVQDVSLGVSSAATTALYAYAASAVGVFDVTAGNNTFYLLAQKTTGASSHFAKDKQLILLFVPTAYGTVTDNAQGDEQDCQVAPDTGMSEVEIAEEKKQAAAFTEARLAIELEIMQARLDKMKASLSDNKSEE